MNHLRHLFVLLIILSTAAACAVDPSADRSAPPVAAETAVDPATAAAAATTDLDLWTPDGLRPDYRVVRTVTGSCFVGAPGVDSADAWRCETTEGDRVLDPCLANPHDPSGPLACPSGDGAVELLQLTEPLPQAFANPDEGEALPPTLTLDNGDRCDLATGATITIEGERVNYLCESGGALIGVPQQDDAIWTVDYSPGGRGEGDIVTIGIAAADAFRGDTAQVGWSSGSNQSGVLESVTAERQDGFTRFVFDFSEGGLPDYEIAYVNEPLIDDDGREIALDGAERLRVWFYYPTREHTAYTGATPRIDDAGNVVAAALGRNGNGNLVWAIGLNDKAGFNAIRAVDGRLLLDIYEPDPLVADLPEIGIGSTDDDELRALADRLFDEGLLARKPTDDELAEFGEKLRRAIAEFELENGLRPDGVAGPETWAALLRETPPERLGTSSRDVMRTKLLLASQEGASVVKPAGDYPVNIRSGPGLDYGAVGALQPGQTVEVKGVLGGADPITTWYEVCCFDGISGWARSDVVRLFGPGELPPAPKPPTEGELGGFSPADRPTHTADGKPILYFTFDDGVMPKETRAVMDILEANGARGTFFVIGRQVQWDPDLTREAVARGHSVQNHTYNHAALDSIDRSRFFQEVERTQGAIHSATDRWASCLRPPYGATDGITFQLARELGLEVVLWTVDTQDWMRPGTEVLVNYIVNNAYPGAIMLMHDGGGERDQTIEALRRALPLLREQGYVFSSLCG